MQGTSKPNAVSSGEPFSQIKKSFIRDRSLSIEARMLAIVYATFVDFKGQAWPSAKTLRFITRFGRDKLYSIRQELVEKGVLVRRQGKGATGRFGAAVYTLANAVLRKSKRPPATGFREPVKATLVAGQNSPKTQQKPATRIQ
jgi:hypothetical protein